MKKPAQVFCLADFLSEEMQARGWNSADVGIRMKMGAGAGLDTLAFEFLLACQDEGLLLDDKMIEGLSRAFGLSQLFFARIHESWLSHPAARVPFEAPENLFFGSATEGTISNDS
jgi:hypothetical protein